MTEITSGGRRHQYDLSNICVLEMFAYLGSAFLSAAGIF